MSILSLTKSYEFFKPESCAERIHIIGCGSVGSTVAELLVRFGLTKLTLYDFDTVEPQNLANQMFRQEHIGMPKVDALTMMLVEINPEIAGSIKLAWDGYVNQKLSGYVFLCVDNIDLRREIATAHKNNPYIKAMFDFRTRLTDAQHYAADWTDLKDGGRLPAFNEFQSRGSKRGDTGFGVQCCIICRADGEDNLRVGCRQLY